MITAIILAKNEESNLKRCIDAIAWCDEVIVADDNSFDQTVTIAKELGIRILPVPKNLNFSEKRNFALKKATYNWVLFIDVDEIVSLSLKNEILEKISFENYAGYYIKRIDFMWGKKILYGDLRDVWILRLALKNKGEWEGAVHEIWHIKGKKDNLLHPLLHYPHPTIKSFIEKINTYTSQRANELYRKKVKVTLFSIIFYTLGKFLYLYFLKLGILDGMEGLIISIIMAFHTFLVRSKLWELWKSKKYEYK